MGKFPVAIKVYDLISFDDTGQMEEMFNREFSILCSVCHPNIVTFYGGIKLNNNGSPSYRIVTEKLKQNLKQYIEKSNESLEDKDKFPILRGVIEGLSHLHFLGMVHRDIKPENIMLDENLVPKIIDLGLSKSKEDRRNMSTKLEGTVAYAAPERLNGGKSSEWTDVYSFGVLGFFVFTLKDPAKTSHDDIRSYFNEKVSEDFRFQLFA